MADPKLVELLQRDVEAWNEWRNSRMEAFDPSRADLIEVDLAGADLIDADLAHANLMYANLAGARLRGAYLGFADLFAANFSGADLTNANLADADLTYADLTGTNLGGVNLVGANLTDADLTGADLTGAKLGSANLVRAKLTGAKFDNTKLIATVLADCDLSYAEGLNTVEHVGPSILDFSTLQNSGHLPLNFLRGCGLPESLISDLPSLLDQPIRYFSCFIRYSDADQSFARRLHDALQERGIRCWLGERQLYPSEDPQGEVAHSVRRWDKVLLCCSEQSLSSWWVDSEIHKVFDKEQELTKVRQTKVIILIPLNLDGYLFDGWTSDEASQIQSRSAVDFRGWETDNRIFEKQFEQVVRALRTDGGREPAPTSKL